MPKKAFGEEHYLTKSVRLDEILQFHTHMFRKRRSSEWYSITSYASVFSQRLVLCISNHISDEQRLFDEDRCLQAITKTILSQELACSNQQLDTVKWKLTVIVGEDSNMMHPFSMWRQWGYTYRRLYIIFKKTFLREY